MFVLIAITNEARRSDTHDIRKATSGVPQAQDHCFHIHYFENMIRM